MNDSVKIVCSVIPGFESIALLECKERLGLETSRDTRGRITFKIEIEKIQTLVELRSVHHYWVVVGDRDEFFNADKTKEVILEDLSKLQESLLWFCQH